MLSATSTTSPIDSECGVDVDISYLDKDIIFSQSQSHESEAIGGQPSPVT
jgi:hypothetical protein